MKVDLWNEVFYNCTALTYVGFPYTYNNEMSIQSNIFRGCRKDITIAAAKDSDAYYFAKEHNYPFREYKASGRNLNYQWQELRSGNWVNLKSSEASGVNTNTLRVPVTAANDGKGYRCIVKTANKAKATTDTATLTVK